MLADTGKQWHYGKAFLTDALAYIALSHPECREEVLTALHTALPDLNEDGRLDGLDDRHVDENWDSVVHALAILQDRSSQSRVLAMYEADLIDTDLLSRNGYQRMMKEGGELPSHIKYFDLPKDVREDWEREQTRLRRLAREASRPPARRAPSVESQPKVGRNEPCPCGSGKKYKHCHGKKR